MVDPGVTLSSGKEICAKTQQEGMSPTKTRTLRYILIPAPSSPFLAFPSMATRVTTLSFCVCEPGVMVGE